MSNVKQLVLIDSIRRDACYVGRLISSTQSGPPAEVMPMIIFAVSNFFALFTLESRKHSSLTSHVFQDPELSDEFNETVKRARHILKLFEDRKRDIGAQIAFLENELVGAHQSEFLGNTWLPLARGLEKDLGLVTYEGLLVASTHSANLALGEEPRAMLRTARRSGDSELRSSMAISSHRGELLSLPTQSRSQIISIPTWSSGPMSSRGTFTHPCSMDGKRRA